MTTTTTTITITITPLLGHVFLLSRCPAAGQLNVSRLCFRQAASL